MNVVQKALDEGNLLDAQRILKRHLPIAGAPDLRGFEWRYFWKQARGEQAHTIATRYPLKHLSLSPDGRVLAAGLLRAGGVILYDAITRKELARLPTAGKTTLSLAFSSDSRLLAVGSDDIESLSGTENGRAEVWDVERSQRVAVLKIRAPFVAFWPGDSKIIVGSGSSFAPDSQSIQLWAYRSPAEATVVLSTNEYRPELSPDGRWMATASTREIVLWDVASLRRLREFACEQEVRSLRFSPDGRLLATGQSQGKVYLWDVSTGSHIGTFVGHTGGADGLAFSTDGALLATGSHDHTLRLWDVSSQRQVRLFGAVGTLCDVCYSKASEELITASYTGQIDFWKTSPTNSLDGMKTTQLRISFSADGNLILGKHQDERITIYSTESGRIIAEILDTFSPIGFLPGGLSFVSWGRLPDRSMAARIWNLGESTPRREVVLGQSAGSPRHPCKALSIDGEILAAGDSAGRVRIWRLRTGQLLQEFQAHKQEILALEVSPDGKFLATASHDVTATLWSIPEWRETIRLKIENRVSDFAFSPRGDILATGHVSQSINLWDTASGRRLAELKGHKGSSQSVSISPDGRTLASASPDMTIRLWNLSTLRQVALFAHPIRWGPATIRFSPDGGGLAIFDGQSELRILRAPTLAEIHGNM
jgi:WD40 repeat protein